MKRVLRAKVPSHQPFSVHVCYCVLYIFLLPVLCVGVGVGVGVCTCTGVKSDVTIHLVIRSGLGHTRVRLLLSYTVGLRVLYPLRGAHCVMLQCVCVSLNRAVVLRLREAPLLVGHSHSPVPVVQEQDHLGLREWEWVGWEWVRGQGETCRLRCCRPSSS